MTGSAQNPPSPPPDAIPAPLADDDDDVSWALKTAAVQWRRGQLADAIEWLKRAVESALEIGNDARAAELEQLTNDVSRTLQSARSSPPAVRPPSEIPAPSARAILDSIHETLEEAASQGLMPTEPVGNPAPLMPPVEPPDGREGNEER